MIKKFHEGIKNTSPAGGVGRGIQIFPACAPPPTRSILVFSPGGGGNGKRHAS